MAKIDARIANENTLQAECRETAKALYSRLSETLTDEQYALLSMYGLLTNARRYTLSGKTRRIFETCNRKAKKLLGL